MGIKMTRADVDKLAGKQPKPEPVPPKVTDTGKIEQQLATLSEQLAQNTAAMAHAAAVMAAPPDPPKKTLHAEVKRDAAGRMSEVIITVL